MQLSLREAAAYFNVSERTVLRWISTRGMPAHRAHERLHCNAIELWEWALENGIPVSASLLEHARRAPDEGPPPVATLVARGGCYTDVDGRTRSEVLRQVVDRLPLPAEVDREFLATVLEAREAIGSTGIGDGIAIPHVRNPVLLHVDEPFVSLFLLRHPIDFDAVDGRPVNALFVVISSSIPMHLRILAQLGFVLRDEQLRYLIGEKQDRDAIMARLSELERRTSQHGSNGTAQ